MKLTLELKGSKKLWLAIMGVIALIAIVVLAYLKLANANPLPANLKNQVRFKVVYPKGSVKMIGTGYQYQSSQKILSYVVNYSSTNIAFQEQSEPPNLGSDSQVYYPVIGVHPYAQFSVPLGNVALTKFYQSGNLQPFGQSAILASHGTLVIANSTKQLTNEQWKNLFESLKIAQ